MKKFVLFSGTQYYPAGGMDDLTGSYDTMQEAMAAWAETNPTKGDWAQIVDRDTWQLVAWI